MGGGDPGGVERFFFQKNQMFEKNFSKLNNFKKLFFDFFRKNCGSLGQGSLVPPKNNNNNNLLENFEKKRILLIFLEILLNKSNLWIPRARGPWPGKIKINK